MRTRILIVDNSEPMREFLKMTLAGVAEVVGECVDGAEALGEYQRLLPDWVLMDIRIKGVDSMKVTQQIMASDPQARILIISDYNESEVRRAAFESGAREYIVKENLLNILEVLTNQAENSG
jgi:DNA-binding NarL/FixJ family response regulator